MSGNGKNYTWHYVLSAACKAAQNVSNDDLDIPESSEPIVAWKRQYGDSFTPLSSNTSFKRFATPSSLILPLPAQSEEGWGFYTLWKTAPVTCDGNIIDLDRFRAKTRNVLNR